jgi:hypothetical protein
MTYNNCAEAVKYFCHLLQERGMPVESIEKRVANAGFGRVLKQDVIRTSTGEIFYVICRPRGRWYPKPSEKVSKLARSLDERLKFMILTFGKSDDSISGLNEDSLLWLLGLASEGLRAYLITIFPKTGEMLWCSAQEAYDIVMRYGVLPQYSLKGLEGQTMCSVPTGWMKEWISINAAPPEVIK